MIEYPMDALQVALSSFSRGMVEGRRSLIFLSYDLACALKR